VAGGIFDQGVRQVARVSAEPAGGGPPQRVDDAGAGGRVWRQVEDEQRSI